MKTTEQRIRDLFSHAWIRYSWVSRDEDDSEVWNSTDFFVNSFRFEKWNGSHVLKLVDEDGRYMTFSRADFQELMDNEVVYQKTENPRYKYELVW